MLIFFEKFECKVTKIARDEKSKFDYEFVIQLKKNILVKNVLNSAFKLMFFIYLHR